ncbi:hypothetical protein PHIN10_16680 [Polynucleobacter sp. HIN10]|nr:hypothetical protein PHIN10_16680 [Polynucleobacter sp. HIN10]
MAQSAPAEEKSPISANVTITNDYKYRGISQTNGQPAIQGGFDYAMRVAFYIGNWNSTISWINNQVPTVTAPVEMDFYAGFKKELIAPGFASDLVCFSITTQTKELLHLLIIQIQPSCTQPRTLHLGP